MSTSHKKIIQEMHHIGLNIHAIVDGQPYQHLLPNCQSIILFGNGGRAMWECFMADMAKNPKRLDVEHPLDQWLLEQIPSLSAIESAHRWIDSFVHSEFHLDFQQLALEGGLGWRSHLGLVIHPTYGLWMGLRFALLLTEKLPPTAIVQSPSPCDDCPKYCANSCLGKALSTAQSWSSKICFEFKERSAHCQQQCDARWNCPVGQEFRHSLLQHQYHQAPKLFKEHLYRIPL